MRRSAESAFRMLTGRDVRPLVAIPSELDAALERLYGAGRTAVGQIVGDVEHVKALKALSVENAKLKKLLAERDLEIEVLKEINRKNGEPAGAPGTVRLRLWAGHPEATRLRADRHGSLNLVLRAAATGERMLP